MSAGPPSMKSPTDIREAGKWLGENLGIALVYLLLAILSLPHGPAAGPYVCLIWPGAGFALAMVLLRGESRIAGIMLGSLLVTFYVVSPVDCLYDLVFTSI